MRDLRIVFMGTPEFAVTILDGILKEGFNVIGVITAPDKPAYRGRKVHESAVKKYASSAGLKILQPTNLKSEEFLKELQDLNPNVQVVVAFRMLPKVVWQFPEYGTFNLHASLLPQYRGAAPINWAIISGEETTGVTTFFLDEKIDTGDVILQLSVPIEPRESAGSLHDKLMHTGSKVVIKTLEQIRGKTVKTQKQREFDLIKEAPKLTKENTEVNWKMSPLEVYNFIRGLNPFPGAWSFLLEEENRLQVKIFDGLPIEEFHEIEAGTIIQISGKIKVATSGGFFEITDLQLPGKKRMKAKDLLNGYSFQKSAKFL
ncbi:methionyl-tRNA formyltransferase [Antarcticibacterium sp. 1MA-6-2]|uniref:methionyl-tRNA formyltransferase n=1 Tax=Antarcticibacterium sp. 1MA-6-2 TaxID=2908210 RepID=UPI001F010EB9|nr:methionyl-tRNA formyltransferase [Antarcticibacterium sp. 1MA-6-2]UJH91844.1 methionyl-tRNA formyltransferase [Antarcticibacterium sp. 1MA-6-2]